jgi:hypothetical protein
LIMFVSQVGYFFWIFKPVFNVWIFTMWLSCLPICYRRCLAQTLKLLAMCHKSLLNDKKKIQSTW